MKQTNQIPPLDYIMAKLCTVGTGKFIHNVSCFIVQLQHDQLDESYKPFLPNVSNVGSSLTLASQIKFFRRAGK